MKTEFANCYIVCVDDEVAILTALKEQLKRLFKNSIKFEFAENPLEAIQVIKDLVEAGNDIPVVISDYIMPQMYGIDFFLEIQEIVPMANKVLLSGQVDTMGLKRSVNETKLFAYIPKPWEEKDLFLTINSALEQYSQGNLLRKTNHQLAETHNKVLSLNEELIKKSEVFSKFVPIPLIQSLFKNTDEEHITKGVCVKKKMNIMFCDIRGFTNISEELELEDCFKFLNEYLGIISPIIMKNHGVIDNYVGDGVLALFNNSDDSIRAALEIHDSMKELAHWTNKISIDSIQVGIGISRGEVMIGTIGTDDRMQTTVIGDNVNVAARLEKLCRTYSFDILISNSVRKNLQNELNVEFLSLGETELKGKAKREKIYGVRVIEDLSKRLGPYLNFTDWVIN